MTGLEANCNNYLHNYGTTKHFPKPNPRISAILRTKQAQKQAKIVQKIK
jgi:hypothetical protein